MGEKPPTEAEDLLAELRRLHWLTAPITLRNTRNTFAREHPLSIFQAVFNHAAAKAGWPKCEKWFFHPLDGPTGNRMQKGRDYRLEVVFPSQMEKQAQEFLDALAAHLANPAHNFLLLENGPPRERSLAALQGEWAGGPGPPAELCLDFITPLPFNPADPKRRWLIGRQQLAQAFASRLQGLFGLQTQGLWPAWQQVAVLPYCLQYTQHRHASKSNQGVQFINGAVGPLYLKGDLQPLLPLLLLGQELHLAGNLSAARGCYRLEAQRPFFDPLLQEPAPYLAAWHKLAEDSDKADDLPEFTQDPGKKSHELCEKVAAGAYRPEAATGFPIAKKSGGTRLIAEQSPLDTLVQRAVLEVLHPVCDRMLQDASLGYRRGRSRRAAFQMISQGAAEGFNWVLETDINSCFDSIPWDKLFATLAAKLPLADRLAQGLLKAFVICPLMVKGKQVQRSRGLLRGSPLSPLLLNLFLDTFDEELEAAGHRLVRYADDMVILVKSREQGEKALQDVRAALDRLGLATKPEKTAIRPLGAGVTFLGEDLGEAIEEEGLQKPLLRKTLYIREQHAFLGLDKDSLTVRQSGQTLARLPLRRIDEVVVFGNNGVSIRLLQRCSRDKIPVSFCSPLGYYVNTLRPDSKRHFAIGGRHLARHAGLSPDQALALAQGLVAAKLANTAAWLKHLRAPGAGRVAARLAEISQTSLAAAAGLEQVRGAEAAAAKEVFSFVNRQIKQPGFKSPKRARRFQADPYNSLLDFAYFLLFCQLNVLLRGAGLNPYLGVLHSHKDNYESLVSDLMEPFRYRMDRMVMRAANLGVIKPADCQPQPKGGFRLAHSALPGFLQAFERELALWLAGEPASLQDLLAAQVAAVARWAAGEARLAFFDLGRPDAGGLFPALE